MNYICLVYTCFDIIEDLTISFYDNHLVLDSFGNKLLALFAIYDEIRRALFVAISRLNLLII